VIISPYTSGTMRVNWRTTLEQIYKDVVRDTVAAKWSVTKIPPDYTRPRQDIDRFLSRVVWLHPRAPNVESTGNSAARAGYYIPRNLRLIHDCDFVLSCIYPDHPSIDSAHEIGVAYAWGKPVVTVDLTHGLGDYAAWRAMSLVVLDSLEMAADYLLYQVQEEEFTQLAQVGDKLPV
jgi:hypothetical protein